MIIECTYGPVSTEVMGTTYNFVADEEGRYVAEVWIPRHIKAFLAVADHYRRIDIDPDNPGLPPVLDSIEPTEAQLGTGDITLRCLGSGFTEESVIYFANQPEPIVFVSENEVTTIVKTDLPWGEVTVAVSVSTAGESSGELDFTFLAAEPATASLSSTEEAPAEEETPAEEEAAVIPLTDITGIGPATEAKLNEVGITDARQVAELSEEEAAALDEQLGLGGRIAREQWVEQAKALLT